MELLIDDNLYTRATEEPYIFSSFLVPDGTSYTCGDNDLNLYYKANRNSTDDGPPQDGVRFKGLQVGQLL